MPTQPRNYYTVIRKDPRSSEWGVWYGSYDKGDCKEEIVCTSGDAHPLASFKIITTGYTQKAIDQAVALMNRA